MADTGGERITDTFRFNHHAVLFPRITAIDRILDATAYLTTAIKGVQEAPPNELAAIQALQTLLLGEVPPIAPKPPPVMAPHPIIEDKEPVVRGTQTLSNSPHATLATSHLQAPHPADGICRQSSKTTLTKSHHH